MFNNKVIILGIFVLNTIAMFGPEMGTPKLNSLLKNAKSSGISDHLNQDEIKLLNKMSGKNWTSGEPVDSLVGLNLEDEDYDSVGTNFSSSGFSQFNLPENFTSSDKWPMCKESFERIVDQGNCGSCWSVSSANTLSDRACIKSGKIKFFSYQDPLECCSYCGIGCRGGSTLAAFNWFFSSGVVSGGLYETNSSCKPYLYAPCHDSAYKNTIPCLAVVQNSSCKYSCTEEFNTNKCSEENTQENKNQCINNPLLIYFSDKQKPSYYYRIAKNETLIMQEIYTNGPITAGFLVFSDFLTYKEGIYKYTTGRILGGHAVKIIGWGIENGVKYWICVNSWGPNWGENGLFRIVRGINHLYIEQFLVTAIFN